MCTFHKVYYTLKNTMATQSVWFWVLPGQSSLRLITCLHLASSAVEIDRNLTDLGNLLTKEKFCNNKCLMPLMRFRMESQGISDCLGNIIIYSIENQK